MLPPANPPFVADFFANPPFVADFFISASDYSFLNFQNSGCAPVRR